MISLSIDRAALSLSALVIGNDPTSGLWLPEEGQGRPGKVWRRQTVRSPFVHGEVLTGAVLEQASIQRDIYAMGATTAALRTTQDELEEALFQWAYDVTLTEDGETLTYACDPADVSWGEADSGMIRGHIAKATVTIPCYPVGA